jgi:hypothetical protein
MQMLAEIIYGIDYNLGSIEHTNDRHDLERIERDIISLLSQHQKILRGKNVTNPAFHLFRCFSISLLSTAGLPNPACLCSIRSERDITSLKPHRSYAFNSLSMSNSTDLAFESTFLLVSHFIERDSHCDWLFS